MQSPKYNNYLKSEWILYSFVICNYICYNSKCSNFVESGHTIKYYKENLKNKYNNRECIIVWELQNMIRKSIMKYFGNKIELMKKMNNYDS